ncbi:hypothetical protein EJJ20_35170 (plasmid) [Pseudomonas poae]|nr:hypothetical protein EJJ20_35170 [Pseudomonas poae]
MAESILSYGIMEPLLVTRLGDRYEITLAVARFAGWQLRNWLWI